MYIHFKPTFRTGFLAWLRWGYLSCTCLHLSGFDFSIWLHYCFNSTRWYLKIFFLFSKTKIFLKYQFADHIAPINSMSLMFLLSIKAYNTLKHVLISKVFKVFSKFGKLPYLLGCVAFYQCTWNSFFLLLPHLWHQGFFTIFFFHRVSAIGNKSWATPQIKIFIFSGILSFHIYSTLLGRSLRHYDSLET